MMPLHPLLHGREDVAARAPPRRERSGLVHALRRWGSRSFWYSADPRPLQGSRGGRRADVHQLRQLPVDADGVTVHAPAPSSTKAASTARSVTPAPRHTPRLCSAAPSTAASSARTDAASATGGRAAARRAAFAHVLANRC